MQKHMQLMKSISLKTWRSHKIEKDRMMQLIPGSFLSDPARIDIDTTNAAVDIATCKCSQGVMVKSGKASGDSHPSLVRSYLVDLESNNSNFEYELQI